MEHSTTSDAEICDRLLRKKDLAQLFACSVRTIERLVQDGLLNPVRIRGAVRFLESEAKSIFSERRRA